MDLLKCFLKCHKNEIFWIPTQGSKSAFLGKTQQRDLVTTEKFFQCSFSCIAVLILICHHQQQTNIIGFFGNDFFSIHSRVHKYAFPTTKLNAAW